MGWVMTDRYLSLCFYALIEISNYLLFFVDTADSYVTLFMGGGSAGGGSDFGCLGYVGFLPVGF